MFRIERSYRSALPNLTSSRESGRSSGSSLSMPGDFAKPVARIKLTHTYLVTASAEECESKWVSLLQTRFRTQLRRYSTGSSKKVTKWRLATSKVATQGWSAIFRLSFNYVARDGVESIEDFHLSNALTALEGQSNTCTTFSKPPCYSLSCIGSTAPTSSV